MNNVSLMGRLTAEPELKKTPNDVSVCSFTLAVNRSTKDSEGKYIADFINCVAWRQTAEFVWKYFHKGNMMGLVGSLQSRTYQDKETGKNRTAYEVNAQAVYFAESKAFNAAVTSTTTAGAPAQQPSKTTYSLPATFTTADLDGFQQVATDEGDLPF